MELCVDVKYRSNVISSSILTGFFLRIYVKIFLLVEPIRIRSRRATYTERGKPRAQFQGRENIQTGARRGRTETMPNAGKCVEVS